MKGKDLFKKINKSSNNKNFLNKKENTKEKLIEKKVLNDKNNISREQASKIILSKKIVFALLAVIILIFSLILVKLNKPKIEESMNSGIKTSNAGATATVESIGGYLGGFPIYTSQGYMFCLDHGKSLHKNNVLTYQGDAHELVGNYGISNKLLYLLDNTSLSSSSTTLQEEIWHFTNSGYNYSDSATAEAEKYGANGNQKNAGNDFLKGDGSKTINVASSNNYDIIEISQFHIENPGQYPINYNNISININGTTYTGDRVILYTTTGTKLSKTNEHYSGDFKIVVNANKNSIIKSNGNIEKITMSGSISANFKYANLAVYYKDSGTQPTIKITPGTKTDTTSFSGNREPEYKTVQFKIQAIKKTTTNRTSAEVNLKIKLASEKSLNNCVNLDSKIVGSSYVTIAEGTAPIDQWFYLYVEETSVKSLSTSLIVLGAGSHFWVPFKVDKDGNVTFGTIDVYGNGISTVNKTAGNPGKLTIVDKTYEPARLKIRAYKTDENLNLINGGKFDVSINYWSTDQYDKISEGNFIGSKNNLIAGENENGLIYENTLELNTGEKTTYEIRYRIKEKGIPTGYDSIGANDFIISLFPVANSWNNNKKTWTQYDMGIWTWEELNSETGTGILFDVGAKIAENNSNKYFTQEKAISKTSKINQQNEEIKIKVQRIYLSDDGSFDSTFLDVNVGNDGINVFIKNRERKGNYTLNIRKKGY